MDVAGYRCQDTKAWPGKIAVVVVAGNGRHSMKDIEAELQKSFTTNAVVFEGHVETQSDLPIVAKKMKLKNKLVRLNTNGKNPELLKKMVERRLVDFVSITITGPLYSGNGDFQKIRDSIKFMQSTKVEHEIVLDWNGNESDARDTASQITGTFVLHADKGFDELRAVASTLEGPKHVRIRNNGGEQSIT
ncbi:hypothetical protein ACFLQ2_01145 [archaeon]